MNRSVMILFCCSLIVLLFIPVSSRAQEQDLVPKANVETGERIFATTCAGYCHGEKGGPGAAPRLAGRGFDADYIEETVTFGLPGTPMKAFGSLMTPFELNAVTAYVKSLNGIASSEEPSAGIRPLSAEAAPGKALFFDAIRGFGRCSTCHQIVGMGLPIAKPITKLPTSASAFSDLLTPAVQTATVKGDVFPALVVMQGREETKLYDLTKAPPVLRTFQTADVTLTKGSVWRHALVTSAYTQQDLASILIFLRAVVKP